jgi:lipopolysaccharide transport system ATP-binding protein
MKPAIRVENLSKRYHIGTRSRNSYRTLRESLTDAMAGSFRRLRHGRSTNGEPDEFWALKDVSFEVQPGEVVGIIGRNGAGKSTLLKILSRVVEPTSGRAEFRGRIGSLLEVGTGFHPELTGRENIYLNGSILGMKQKEIDRNFDEIVAFSEIEQFLDTPVKRYSSGMFVRLAFAVAAHLEPEILIVDEVLAVGDGAFQKKCLGKMREVSRSGRTVLLVSHNLGTVRTLCQHAFWLADGRLVDSGRAFDVTDRYVRAGAQAQSQTVELSDVKDRIGGTALRLRRLSLNGGTPVMHGEPFDLSLEYETSQNVHDVAFGGGFSDLNGTRILSFDSDLFDPRVDVPGGRAAAVRLRLDTLPLQPGPYLLDVGARSGDNFPLDYLPGCARVEVLPGPSTPGLIIRNGGGGARLPTTIDWTEHSTARDSKTASSR